MPALRGIWGFPLTPFSRDAVDLELLSAGVRRQVDGRVDVVCASGAIAQVDVLTGPEWAACVREVVVSVDGDVPVAATLPPVERVAGHAETAARLGAEALVFLPISADVRAEAGRLRDAAAAAPGLPLVLYHRPPLRLEPGDLALLLEIDALAGVKDGHRDVRRFRRLRGTAGDRLLWLSAWEDVALAFWATGCDGYAPASAAYAPSYARTWLAALERGDVEGARALLEAHAYPLTDLRLSRPGIDVTAVKALAAELGLDTGDVRAPAQPLTEGELARVRELAHGLQPLIAAEAAR